MAGLSVFYVEMNMRVLSMFCGRVLFTRIRGKGLWLSLGPYYIGEAFNDFDALDNIEKAFLC